MSLNGTEENRIPQLRLNTLVNSRKSLTRIIRLFNAGNIAEAKFRALIYGFANLLQYWKVEKDLEIEKRIEAIEDIVNAKQ